MYGYVNNSTGQFHLFRTHGDAEQHALDAGLTNFTVRSVTDNRRVRPGVPAGGSALGPTMDAFLAGGQ